MIATHLASLHRAQSRGFVRTLAKATRAVDDPAATLARGHARRDRTGVQAAVQKLTRARWVRRVLAVELTGDQPGRLRLGYALDPAARGTLETESFGKRLLVTDHEDWPIAAPVAAYRFQNDAEQGFRQLMDPDLVGSSPMFHWTDATIRVHAFSCELLDHLAGIEETVLRYPFTGGRPRVRGAGRTRPTQDRLFDLFGLHRYAPGARYYGSSPVNRLPTWANADQDRVNPEHSRYTVAPSLDRYRGFIYRMTNH